jgi:hypothetical protein
MEDIERFDDLTLTCDVLEKKYIVYRTPELPRDNIRFKILGGLNISRKSISLINNNIEDKKYAKCTGSLCGRCWPYDHTYCSDCGLKLHHE